MSAACPGPVLHLGATALRVRARVGFGLVIEGAAEQPVGTPSPYLDAILADATTREAFFALVDREGLVVCQHLLIEPTPYRRVAGKHAQRRLSQGEHFHHDGCSTPIKPRIVEIRCPPQPFVRSIGTSVAPFPAVVDAMLRALPAGLRRAEGLHDWYDAVVAEQPPSAPWDQIQGAVNRTLRQLPAQLARRFFLDVDTLSGGYTAPWTLGESRFIANDNAAQTAQHRRAYQPPWTEGTPKGHLLKRWPAEEIV